MSVRRRKWRDPKTGEAHKAWMIDIQYTAPDGKTTRIRKVAARQSKRGAESEEREIRDALVTGTYGKRKEVMTYDEWFRGRFWREWVIGRQNKPSERENKECIYRCYLNERFGHMRLDDMAEGPHIAEFRAALVEQEEAGRISLKRINNILAVLSKSLRYAEEQRLIDQAPRVGTFKLERPEVVWWEYEEYARILAAAQNEGPSWHLAVCLAGEAGLRMGETRALIWERDIDLVSGTVTVNEQTRTGRDVRSVSGTADAIKQPRVSVTGTPKGKTRRKIPMTSTLLSALRSVPVVRRGHVLRTEEGMKFSDGQMRYKIHRICRQAGLPEKGWHILRHSFGTHAALFGINPWRLMTWMGHKRIDETMKYVHIAENHMRKLPEPIIDAARGEPDPDHRVLKMLSARAQITLESCSAAEDLPKRAYS